MHPEQISHKQTQSFTVLCWTSPQQSHSDHTFIQTHCKRQQNTKFPVDSNTVGREEKDIDIFRHI